VEIAHEAVSRRPPIPLDTIVARTEGCTYDANVWDVSIVQGPFSVAPRQTQCERFATFSSLYGDGVCVRLTCTPAATGRGDDSGAARG
jgi:hypothetical protein